MQQKTPCKTKDVKYKSKSDFGGSGKKEHEGFSGEVILLCITG